MTQTIHIDTEGHSNNTWSDLTISKMLGERINSIHAGNITYEILSLKTNKAEFANIFNNLFEILLIKCEK